MGSELVKSSHLDRKAIVYVRQSSTNQVLNNQESLRLQYGLREWAHELGWREPDIEVIDCDLGLSGAAAAHRAGFKDLVARVTLGEIGMILSIEVTRLARNCSDWYPLLDVCGHRQCLIADRDGVYDPGTPNGRLLLGLKGTISELELHTIRGRLTAGLLAKAQRGELEQMLPVGLMRDANGAVVKDPNREVQERIDLVFECFLSLRTAAKVVRTLAARGLSLPRRDRDGEVRWKPPTLANVTRMLKNPAYAGAFVHGRSRQVPAALSGGRIKRSRPSGADWKILVKDRYPAYVSWRTFEQIQSMLRDNRADYLRIKGRGIPRDGAALLHGITWCGECGHRMYVRYKGGSQYVCNHLHHQNGAPVCQCLRAASIDEQVAAAFLAAVAPAEIEALSRARKVEREAEASLRLAEEKQIQRLRYQADLAERQFNRVDPDNRLVAGELERRWESALSELRHAEEALTRRTQPTASQILGIAPRLREKVIALGERLPTLWADPKTSREHRKALLRCLIDKVVLRRTGRDKADVRIVWRGGETSQLNVAMPVNAVRALPRFEEMERRICELAAAGNYDDEIARVLTNEDHRSPGCATAVLPVTVRGIRLRRGIKITKTRGRWRPVENYITLTEVVDRLGIPRKWFQTQLNRGALITRKEASGRYLFPDTAEALASIRKLRDQDAELVDLVGESA